MRNIDPEIWQDEFIMTITQFERLLWIGLIITCADDQGRFPKDLLTIKVKIFPNENITTKQIDNALEKFTKSGKILIYKDRDKEIVQIKNWWKHQRHTQWAYPSKHLAPKGWDDFYRFNGKGKTIKVSENWQQRNPLHSSYEASTSSPSGNHVKTKSPPSGDKDKDKDKDKGEGEVKKDKTHPPTPHQAKVKTRQAGKAGKDNQSSSIGLKALKTKEHWTRFETAMKIFKSSGLRNPKLKEVSVLVATRNYKNNDEFVSLVLGALASAYADPTANDKAIIAAHRIEENTVPPEFKNKNAWSSIPDDVLKAAGVKSDKSSNTYSMEGWS